MADRNTKHLRALAPLLLYVLFGCGCALTRAPELSVVDAGWGDVGEDARQLLVQVVLRNPTSPREAVRRSEDIGGALRLLEVQYEVSLDGRVVYRGRRDARATLAAGGERTIALPAVVSRQLQHSDDDTSHAAAGTFHSYRITGHVRYLTADRLSEILADLGWPHRRARFSAEGRVVEPQAAADARR